MTTNQLKKYCEELKLRPEVALDIMAAHAARLEMLNETARAALQPFAKAHLSWSGGNAQAHFSAAVVPADFRAAAMAMESDKPVSASA